MEYLAVLNRFEYADGTDISERLADLQPDDYQKNRDIINSIVLWKLNRCVSITDQTIDLLNAIQRNPSAGCQHHFAFLLSGDFSDY